MLNNAGRVATLLGLLLGPGCSIETPIKGDVLAPVLGFEAPEEGAEVFEGTEVTFIAKVIDEGTSHEDIAVTWYQDGDSKCDDAVVDADDRSSCTLTVTADATVKVVAEDPARNQAEATIAVYALANQPPTVAFTEPVVGPEYYTEFPLDLGLDLSDDFDAPADLTLSWASDVDGVLSPSGGPATSDGSWSGSVELDAGVHTLTIQVVDSLGASASDSVVVEVFGPNSVPACELEVVSTDVVVGDTVEVHLSASDTETASADLEASLDSNLDGVVLPAIAIPASGDKTEYLNGLSAGTHALTLRVVDGYGDDFECYAEVKVCDDTWYRDNDNDGFGDPLDAVVACDAPSGFVEDDTDCDDTDPFTHPGAAAIEDLSACMTDGDGDGYGALVVVAGAVAGTDCDDDEPSTHPGATEVCDEVDNDCDSSVDEGVQTTFYDDDDSDGYGDPASSTLACTAPSGTVADNTDCDDTDDDINPAADEICDPADTDEDCNGLADDDDSGVTGTFTEFYADADGDGRGDPSTTTDACDLPSGFVEDDEDCLDTDANTYPGAAAYESATDCMTDADGDDYGDSSPFAAVTAGQDCDDDDNAVHPAATETCNEVDDNCDGTVDEGVETRFYADTDGDGYGDPAATDDACSAPTGFVSDDTDCDDTDSAVHPAASEVCNGTDDDCDGDIDDDDSSVDTSTYTTWYADSDGDGYGDLSSTTQACDAPTGFVSDTSDCDDTDAAIHPAADEICDTADTDEDCNGLSDDDDPGVTGTFTTWYEDSDSDGYGNPSVSTDTCDLPTGYVDNDDDCDDSDGGTNPGQAEVCDAANKDEDCDGLADDDDPSVAGTFTTFYADADGDGYGDPSSTTDTCDLPSGFVSDSTDCDDANAAIHPAASEVCDSADTDEDCDGLADDDDPGVTGTFTTFYADTDGDGFGDLSATTATCDQGSGFVTDTSDCDDSAASTYPGAPDAWYDGIDADCDGNSDYDADGDGEDSDSYSGVDCDDTDELVNTSATEVCDGIDNDCNGLTDFGICGEWSLDDFVRIDGIAQSDYASEPSVGDIDGDGDQDLIIVAPGHGSATGVVDHGAAYLFYGPITANTDLNSADWWVYGSGSGDGLGGGVVGIADISGDGYDDFLVGAPYDGSDNGEMLLYLGSATQRSGYVASHTTFSSGGYYGRIYGTESRDFLGLHGAHAIGDIDNDGIVDLGAWFAYNDDSGNNNNGSALLLLSDSVSLTGGAWNAIGATDVNGQATYGYSGEVQGTGDVDGDGIDDMLIGASNPSWAGAAPAVHFVEGGQALLTAGGSVDIASVYNSQYLEHSSLGAGSGFSVGGGGDINGDGYADMVMKDNYAYDTLGNQVGHVYIVLGSTSVPGNNTIDNVYDLMIEGDLPSSTSGKTRFGETAALTPDRDRDGIYEDFDGDGDADLVVGQNDGADGGVFVFFSGSLQDDLTAGVTNLVSEDDADAILRQPNNDDEARDIAIGDLDGDGSSDLIVGAGNYDAGGTTATGGVWVVQGTLE